MSNVPQLLPSDGKIVSEAIEPFACYLIGKWFAKCELARQAGKNIELEDALQKLWFGVRAINRVAICCPEAVHFSIAANNETRRVASYIEECIGINPIVKEHPLFPTRG